MDKPEILAVPPIPPELRAMLEARFTLVEHVRGRASPGQRVAVITSMGGADAALMDELPDLKLIACNGTGLDRIDLAEARRRGVVVRNTPDEVTDDTADFAIGLIYAACRRIAEADRFVRAGRWGAERMPPSRRVVGRRVGVVGLGKIGAKIAERASGAGMVVSYTGPREKPGLPYAYVADLKALARDVDVLVLSCPGGEATRRIVDAAVLAALGAEGVLVNVSRGEVVDEEALIAALTDGTIAGAGLDVFENEPRLDARFLALDNAVLSPHHAAITPQTRHDIARTLTEAVSDFLAGRPVPDAAA
jgi:hydroxypyruvate reductase